jgi:hypothetical protein
MRLLTSLLVASLLLTVSVSANDGNTLSLQRLSLASLQAPINQVIVRGNGGLPRHRGSGRLESYQWLERSLA